MDQTKNKSIPASDVEKDKPTDGKPKGFEARYLAFLDTVTDLRPKLHRYCARMTGSVFEGEDVVQDALLEAYRKLDQFDDSRRCRLGFFASHTIDASTCCVAAASEDRQWQRLSGPKPQCRLSRRRWESEKLSSIWY